MTKEQYLEMCTLMGTEPKDSEMPVEFEDLNEDVQAYLGIYNMLQDSWDTVNGIYIGKNLSNIKDFIDIMEVEYPKSFIQIINMLDQVRREIINTKKPAS
jgi:hypothetical protein